MYRQYGLRLKQSEIKALSEEDIKRKIIKLSRMNQAALKIQKSWNEYRLKKAKREAFYAARLIQLTWRNYLRKKRLEKLDRAKCDKERLKEKMKELDDMLKRLRGQSVNVIIKAWKTYKLREIMR